MLICPQCRFENPNHYQFCQQCGTSLTHKPCFNCQASISWSALTCQDCGALTGTVWRAIIAETQLESSVALASNKAQESAFPAENCPKTVLLALEEEYLDLGQRYRLLTTDGQPILEEIATVGRQKFYQGTVIDCQPLQQSVLEVLIAQSAELLDFEDSATTVEEASFALWQKMGIPEIALPYFRLKDLSPAIPLVRDAWLEQGREVILLKERTSWQSLADLLASEPLPSEQIIYWLNHMVKLWQALEGVNCRQSLLVESNLRVDEDQSFGLEQLYQDSPQSPPTLAQVAQLWQRWLTGSSVAVPKTLTALMETVAQGELVNLIQIQSQLQELAHSQQEAAHQSQPLELPIFPEFDEDILDSGPQVPLTDTSDSEELSTAVLPMEMLSLADAGATDRGSQRHHNEDYFGMKTQIRTQQSNQGKTVHGRGLYIVCDGMGGHSSGEVASAMAVESLQRYFSGHWQEQLPQRETIVEGILQANQILYQINQDNARSGSGRMGTTLVMAMIQDTKVAIAHVGDSRAYCFSRKRGLEQLTVDHEVGQKAIQSGIDPKTAYSRPDAYQLTQALGPHDNNYVQPDIQFFDLQEDSLLLLCSDGLSDNELIETSWQSYLTPMLSANHNLEKGLRRLIEFANQHNGHDNITIILVRIKVRPHMPLDDW